MVMCSDIIDPVFILESFWDGAEGVLVAGCHPNDCRYISGRGIILLKGVLEQFDVKPERLRLEWIPTTEGAKFAKVVKEMVEDIKKLGLNHCVTISIDDYPKNTLANS